MVSSLVIPIFCLPLIRFYLTNQTKYLYIFRSTCILAIAIQLSRMLLPKYKCLLRPQLARDCNVLNKGGDCSKCIGMPSGHMLISTFVLVSMYGINVYVIGVLFFMGASRMRKKCHTFNQVIVGCIVGLLFRF